MHRVVMARMCARSSLVVALLAASLGGCGGDEPPDFGPPVERGSVVVTWSLQNAAGEDITCAALGAVDAYVAVGGQPRIVTCGDEQRVSFDELVPQRYPVVIRLRGLAETTLPQGERFDNVTIEGGKATEYDHTFMFDENNGNTGRVRFSWQVDSRDADIGCAFAGATTVYGETTGASVSDFSFDTDCEDGEYEQGGLRPGNYEVILFLRDAQGENLGARSAAFRITRQATAEGEVNFASSNRPTASMYVPWTISSSAAADVCREDWSMRLLIQEDRMNPIETASATAACDRGEYRFDDLIAPANPIADRYKLTVTLVEELRGDIATAFVEDLQLLPAQTTSVAVDLTPP